MRDHPLRGDLLVFTGRGSDLVTSSIWYDFPNPFHLSAIFVLARAFVGSWFRWLSAVQILTSDAIEIRTQ